MGDSNPMGVACARGLRVLDVTAYNHNYGVRATNMPSIIYAMYHNTTNHLRKRKSAHAVPRATQSTMLSPLPPIGYAHTRTHDN